MSSHIRIDTLSYCMVKHNTLFYNSNGSSSIDDSISLVAPTVKLSTQRSTYVLCCLGGRVGATLDSRRLWYILWWCVIDIIARHTHIIWCRSVQIHFFVLRFLLYLSSLPYKLFCNAVAGDGEKICLKSAKWLKENFAFLFFFCV